MITNIKKILFAGLICCGMIVTAGGEEGEGCVGNAAYLTEPCYLSDFHSYVLIYNVRNCPFIANAILIS